MKKKDEYADCFADLNKKLEVVKKLKNNEFPEMEMILELQFKIWKQNDDFYIFPQDIEELAEQLKEFLQTEKLYLNKLSKT